MSSRKNLVGQVFGRWLVLSFSHLSKTGAGYWNCQCSCGELKKCRSGHLISKVSQSCGCLRTEQKTKHSMCNTTEYHIWEAIKHRCLNKNDLNYRHYGGRGITICEQWMDFIGFYEDMGNRPTKSHSIDRINNDGNYEKNNCRWATRKEQMSNTSCNAFVEWEGKKVRRLELVKRYNLTTEALRKRLSRGWSLEEALLTPVRT